MHPDSYRDSAFASPKESYGQDDRAGFWCINDLSGIITQLSHI